jgi:hypothetical protein
LLVAILNSVSDPEPDWIRIQSGQWIRIRIQKGKNDPHIKEKSSIADPGHFGLAFFCLLLFEGTFRHFSKIKSQKESQKKRVKVFRTIFA